VKNDKRTWRSSKSGSRILQSVGRLRSRILPHDTSASIAVSTEILKTKVAAEKVKHNRRNVVDLPKSVKTIANSINSFVDLKN
jgi:hypothetical protein